MTCWRDSFQEERIRIGGLCLNTASGQRNGAPLTLLHGVARRWTDFAPLLPELVAHHHVHALDFRGHGLSDRTDGGYLIADYTRDATCWVEGLARRLGQPVIVYGHSLGAMVAAAVAAQASGAVRAIVLEDPPYHTMGTRIRQTPYYQQFIGMRELARRGGSTDELARGLAEIRVPTDKGEMPLGGLRDEASLRQSAKCLSVTDAEVLTPIIEGRWFDDHEEAAIWGEVQCPTLLLQADILAGGALTDEDARRIETGIRRCTRVHLSGAGHLIHWQQSEAVLRLVNRFVERCAA